MPIHPFFHPFIIFPFIHPPIHPSIDLSGKVLCTPRQLSKIGQQLQYQVLFFPCKISFWRQEEIFTKVPFLFSMQLVILIIPQKNHTFFSIPHLSNYSTTHQVAQGPNLKSSLTLFLPSAPRGNNISRFYSKIHLLSKLIYCLENVSQSLASTHIAHPLVSLIQRQH